jgi:hypothetical protein
LTYCQFTFTIFFESTTSDEKPTKQKRAKVSFALGNEKVEPALFFAEGLSQLVFLFLRQAGGDNLKIQMDRN